MPWWVAYGATDGFSGGCTPRQLIVSDTVVAIDLMTAEDTHRSGNVLQE